MTTGPPHRAYDVPLEEFVRREYPGHDWYAVRSVVYGYDEYHFSFHQDAGRIQFVIFPDSGVTCSTPEFQAVKKTIEGMLGIALTDDRACEGVFPHPLTKEQIAQYITRIWNEYDPAAANLTTGCVTVDYRPVR